MAPRWETIKAAYERKAKALLKDDGALRKVVQGARAWLEKQKKIPLMQGTVEEMIGVIDLLTAYADGKYRQVPKRMLVAMVIGYIQLHSVALSCHCFSKKAHLARRILASLMGV